jgi:TonB-dependent starch-binding outer membrane protein SusC
MGTRYLIYSFIVQCLLVTILMARESNAQVQSINDVMLDQFQLKEVGFRDALIRIEKLTNFNFVYTRNDIPQDVKITLDVRRESLGNVLLEISRQARVKFQQVNNNISVKRIPPEEQIQNKIEVIIQTRNVTGRITSQEDGLGLPGVNVIEKGTNNGTVTDVQGSYYLEVTEGATLVFSSVGYNSQEVEIGNRTVVDLVMTTDIRQLDELVVVGYGTQQSREITGAMSIVPERKLRNLQVTSISEALPGLSSGVHVNQISGEPGAAPSIRVRGVGSITAGNEPLFVIDGFPTESTALSSFSVNDIESITILKDASATSIYGSRGSNGVILITTKKGRVGPARISFNSSIGISQVTHKLDVLSPEEFVSFAIDAVNRSWEYLGNSPDDPMSSRPPFYQVHPYYLTPESWVRTDWQDEIFQVAPVHNYQLSIDGGNESTRYKVSGSLYDQNGIIKSSYFKRYTLSMNVDSDLSTRLRLSVGLNGSKIDRKVVDHDGQWNSGVVATAIGLPGFFDVINEDGSYPSFAGMGHSTSGVRNPMIFINEYDDRFDEYRMLGNISAEYDILKGLYFKSLYGFDFHDTKNNFFRNTINFDVPAVPNFPRNTFNGAGRHATVTRFDWLSENTFHYNLTIDNDHRINALLGFTAQKVTIGNSQMNATNFPDNLVPTLNAGQVTTATTTRSEWSMLSYLSRINYGFRERYFTTLSLRRDGSSRFGQGNRWGYFPSASFGWVISEENFLNNSPIINNLKIKASYGVSGNNAIPNYGSIGLLSYSYYVVGNTIVPGQVPSTLSNDRLGWETSRQLNAGFDIGLFGNRIQLSTDVYRSINDNLLLNVPVPSILGVTSSLQNIGKVRNKGLEFTLITHNINRQFDWSTDFNISFNRNIVLELGPEGTPIRSTSNQMSHITQVGRPVGDFFGYIFDGVYNTTEEINNRPSLATDRPGDPIVRDVNEDGAITVEDRTVLGNYQPNFFYGISNTFRYKGFDLSILIQGVQGADVMSLIYRQVMPMTGRTNSYGLARERWRSPEEPGNGQVFAASIDVRGVRRDPSSFYMQDGSFMRVRNITLGYNLDPKILDRLRISASRVYISSLNPFTFTNYIGFNPEVSSYHNALTPGVDYMNYPLSKTLTVGLNLTF